MGGHCRRQNRPVMELISFSSCYTMHRVDNIFAGNDRRRERTSLYPAERSDATANDLFRRHAAGKDLESLFKGRRCLWQRPASCPSNVHCHDVWCEFPTSFVSFLLLCTQVTSRWSVKTSCRWTLMENMPELDYSSPASIKVHSTLNLSLVQCLMVMALLSMWCYGDFNYFMVPWWL